MRVRQRLLGAALLATAACVAVLALLLEPEEVLAARPLAGDAVVPAPHRQGVSQPAPERTLARRVYPYSIIPGGVSGRDELARVIKTDKVVAAHYASFDVDKAVNTTVRKRRAVYVSYRKGDQVYWTAGKLMLAEGETLLTDGRNEMRARCANRISDEPQLPVELNAPSAEELDSIVGVSMGLGGLGLDDPAYSAAGSINGLGLALASNEAPSNSNAAGASRGRVSLGHSRPGNSKSGSGDGSPNTVAPPQNLGEDTGNTPGEPTMSDSNPSTVPPEVPPLTPGGEPPRGSPWTPLLPIQNEPPEWPPGTLPEEPDEDVHEVPEPDTLWLSAAAFAAMVLLRRRANSLLGN